MRSTLSINCAAGCERLHITSFIHLLSNRFDGSDKTMAMPEVLWAMPNDSEMAMANEETSSLAIHALRPSVVKMQEVRVPKLNFDAELA